MSPPAETPAETPNQQQPENGTHALFPDADEDPIRLTELLNPKTLVEEVIGRVQLESGLKHKIINMVQQLKTDLDRLIDNGNLRHLEQEIFDAAGFYAVCHKATPRRPTGWSEYLKWLNKNGFYEPEFTEKGESLAAYIKTAGKKYSLLAPEERAKFEEAALKRESERFLPWDKWRGTVYSKFVAATKIWVGTPLISLLMHTFNVRLDGKARNQWLRVHGPPFGHLPTNTTWEPGNSWWSILPQLRSDAKGSRPGPLHGFHTNSHR